MKESESRRAAIVKRLESLDISTKRELDDILHLASLICRTPIALITLLDNDTQHIKFRVGLQAEQTTFKDSFCRYTIEQEDVLEVRDALQDERFKNNPLVLGDPNIRFYAGSPLTAQEGLRIGSLCVINRTPQILTEEQRQILKILSRQVSTILDFELSLRMLKDETNKLHASELKLKSIFQSSPTAHIFIDDNYRVRAFNVAAADFIARVNKKTICEGNDLFTCVSPAAIPLLQGNIDLAFNGQSAHIEEQINYEEIGRQWWAIDFNTVKNVNGIVIGVSIDASNISDRMFAYEKILTQHRILAEIAHIQSHGIRRPVANLKGLVPLLQDPLDEDFGLHYSMLKFEVEALDGKIQEIVELTNELNVKPNKSGVLV